jgi:hypothetical protein
MQRVEMFGLGAEFEGLPLFVLVGSMASMSGPKISLPASEGFYCTVLVLL